MSWLGARALLSRFLPRALRRWGQAAVFDRDALRFVRHNRAVWRDWAIADGDGEILVDYHGISQTLVACSYFLNVLARESRSRIVTFVPLGSRVDPVFGKVYGSFNAGTFVSVRASERWAQQAEVLLGEALGALKGRKALLDLECHGIRVGLDVYESYLRRYCAATVDMDDPRLEDVLREAVLTLCFWEDYLGRHSVSAVVVSHDCYVEYNVLCRLAYKHGIPVYFAYALGMTRADRPHTTAIKYRHYRAMFSRIPEEQRQAGLDLAREQLRSRLAGERDLAIAYVTASSFDPTRRRDRVLERSGRFKVLICTHCFHDNPHAYEPLPFVDFVAWLEFLEGVAERADYDWYLKVHPDPLPGTEETIRAVLGEDTPITILPPDVPHQQLAEEGIDFVLTMYGTVGHEYPLLGVQVLNAAFNPHVAYDFNWHARSVAEYEDLLLRLPELGKEIDPEEVYEFYYMRYHHVRPDDLLFPSYREMLRDLTPFEQTASPAYKYFLDRWTSARHEQMIARVGQFLASGKREYFSRGPEIEMDEIIPDLADRAGGVVAVDA